MSAQVSQMHEGQMVDLLQRSHQMLAEQQALHNMRSSVQRTLDTSVNSRSSPRSASEDEHRNELVHAGEVMYRAGEGGRRRSHLLNETQLRATLRAHEFSKHAELENLKQQYEFWLNKRNVEAVRFVEDFNAYRAKTKERLKGAETELLRVYRHARSLSRVVEKIRKGEYPMRQTGRVAVPCIHVSVWYSQ